MADGIIRFGPDGPSIPVTDIRWEDATQFNYTMRVVRTDGLLLDNVTLTIGPDLERAITYREYRTGPSPWWKRAWRRVRG